MMLFSKISHLPTWTTCFVSHLITETLHNLSTASALIANYSNVDKKKRRNTNFKAPLLIVNRSR